MSPRLVHRRTRHGSSSTRGLLASVTAVLCLAAYALGLAHVAVERHVTCPEHAEVTHVRAGQGAAAAQPRGAPRPLAVRADPEAAGEEDHCLLVALNRAASLPAPDGLAAGPLGPVEQAPCAVLPALAPREAVFRLAPKTSPPAFLARV